MSKSLLITGGTGSFGKAFVDHLLDNCPDFTRIVIYSRDELKQWEMQNKLVEHERFNALRFFIGNVRDKERLEQACEKIDYVIHAAALKQVHTAEYNPTEFVKTNINGAENVINAAFKNNVKKVVALSTDKAAAPINLYGATKLCSDKLFLAANNMAGRKDTRFCTVRYGNVMGSRGSVIPFFLNKIKSGKLTITDERMTRFNITLSEGVSFVDFALKNSIGGELFVPKLPSYNIMDIVKAIAPNSNYEICGIRAGEKIHEEMITCSDSRNTLDCGKYYVVIPIEKYFKNYLKLFPNHKRVPNEFSYSSGNNNHFLKVEEIRELIKLNIDKDFQPA
ncbi:UDP-N-acetylglucosamine 4,6-dehydratase (inverting) [Prochlorococcus marinus str. XMU1401]|uniref:UDP-N-acetylglucosamine 4,6-dehydratase (Inverting) n=1 Tax=Prochlorococcus marinus str. XMU1401 TaxID=2052594 RepID=A0A8I2BGU2_PROMR|nr:UDP-N-acetylglucosamine 4,6-dehydratase (inverting) [Prochlorococcus marinus]MBO8223292.1 UDP-N-acetylglucosamine 4,6-dehydratase (inverting) [Prochlorococcus marinus str. XMU1401]MBW3059824.1 UDP-N-acetylglucosamine 4,6-dehydratase (inverting) [Prochlorococcus marinus str. XMU1401E]MCQ9198950.1 UDP-N-acetylglucosamine 4,6-dehydratase (inverting) [Prochlorococcus marinus XMU1429]PJC83638.1 UDP-N-acetylglucosamine 4,6-dehydratase (inverting) [Prochlorococcus marinus str. XMU1401]